MFSSRSGAAKLSLAVIIGLVSLKIAVAVITGSLSILAQAADSFLDLFAVTITFIAVRIAVKPADGEHPFGHGKVESVAAIVQAMLIFTAAGFIVYSAIHRITSGATIEMTEAGIGVMLVSILASIFLSRHLLKVARATDSMALQANARNIAADVYSAAAVFLGLILVRITGLTIIDPILALLVAIFIIKVAFDVLRNSFGELIDVKLPEDEERLIMSCLSVHDGEIVGFHKLRTRKSGPQRYIDLHVVFPRYASVEDAHHLCDYLERDIGKQLHHTSVTIHVEPCGDECYRCTVTCNLRR